jgi:hypothetical protein
MIKLPGFGQPSFRVITEMMVSKFLWLDKQIWWQGVIHVIT